MTSIHLFDPGIAFPAAIIVAAVLGVVARPLRLPEFWWALAGAFGLVLCGTLSGRGAALRRLARPGRLPSCSA